MTSMSPEYHRAWRKSNPDLRAKERERHAARYRNPEERQKRAARALVQRAIARGDLVPEPCALCCAQAEAHHDDYSRPLEVRWLCPLHHQQHHAAERARAAAAIRSAQ